MSYSRLIECLPAVLVPLSAYWRTRLGRTRGIAFIDSLPWPVCHNRRLYSYQVFAGTAQRGKSSRGWFYGFKLHFVMNDGGDLLVVRFTPGNVDDRAPVPGWAEGLWGKLFGDRGYLGQELFERLEQTGVQLITKLKRNRRNKLMPLWDKLLLRKRALIESGGATQACLPNRPHASSQCVPRLRACLGRLGGLHLAGTQAFPPSHARRAKAAG